jgi:hypothetical protein
VGLEVEASLLVHSSETGVSTIHTTPHTTRSGMWPKATTTTVYIVTAMPAVD